jgi:large subunit ribosomal protein L29
MAKKEKKAVAVETTVRESETAKIRKMDEATINKRILELKQELFNLRFQAAVGKLENTAQLGKTKKQIARMKTVLTERAKALR